MRDRPGKQSTMREQPMRLESRVLCEAWLARFRLQGILVAGEKPGQCCTHQHVQCRNVRLRNGARDMGHKGEKRVCVQESRRQRNSRRRERRR